MLILKCIIMNTDLMNLVLVSVSVHLFPKNYKYIIYTKLNNEEETSIKAQGHWHGGHQYLTINKFNITVVDVFCCVNH